MPPPYDPNGAEDALREVLAQPPFVGTGVGTAGLWERLWDILRQLFRDTGDLYVSRPVSFWALIIILSLISAVLIWHITVTMRDLWRSISRVGEVEEDRVLVQALDLEEAAGALRRGDHRRAVELAWSTTVDALSLRRPTARSATPRERARALMSHLEAEPAGSLERLLRAHERACYAGVPTTVELAEEALAEARRLLDVA